MKKLLIVFLLALNSFQIKAELDGGSEAWYGSTYPNLDHEKRYNILKPMLEKTERILKDTSLSLEVREFFQKQHSAIAACVKKIEENPFEPSIEDIWAEVECIRVFSENPETVAFGIKWKKREAIKERKLKEIKESLQRESERILSKIAEKDPEFLKRKREEENLKWKKGRLKWESFLNEMVEKGLITFDEKKEHLARGLKFGLQELRPDLQEEFAIFDKQENKTENKSHNLTDSQLYDIMAG